MHKEKEYLPRCYGLSWDFKKKSLLFKIEKRLISKTQEFFQGNNKFMEYFLNEYTIPNNFANFGKPEKPFGFEDQFQWQKENQYDIIYSWSLPPVLYETKKPCVRCKGKGKIRNYITCYDCRGTGKGYLNTKDSFFTSGMLTFHILSWYMGSQLLNESVMNLCLNDRRQLMHVETTHTQGMWSCSISGWASKEVLDWINKVPNNKVQPLLDAMDSVEKLIWANSRHSKEFEFSFYAKNRFSFKIPGGASSFGTCGGIINPYYTGEALGGDNVDSRIQQLYLIVGMASLSDQVENWLRNDKKI